MQQQGYIMFRFQWTRAALAAVAVASAMPAAATTLIDFSDRPDYSQGTNVISYPEATFTGSDLLFVNGAGVGKDLCVFGSLGCNGTLTVTFTTAVSNLSFTTLGDNFVSSLFITIGFAQGVPLNAVAVLDGYPYQKDFIDLSAYTGITSLILSSDDVYGVAYDDFRFEASPADGGVPEPASWALLLTGFGALGIALRRRPAIA